MTTDARFSPNFTRKLTHPSIVITIQVVQHCGTTSTAKLLI